MITRISLLLFFLIIFPAAFIYYKRLRRCKRLFPKILFALPNLVLLVLTIYFMVHDNNIARNADAVGIYLILLLFTTLPELIFSAVLGISLLLKNKMRKIIMRLGAVLATSIACAVVVGYVSCFTVIKVGHHNYTSPDVPECFDGYRIVHVSDLHLGTYNLFPGTVDRIVKKVNEQHGDVIFFTGDLVNFSHTEAAQFINRLREMKARDGVYSVLGNHDYLRYVSYNNESERLRYMEEMKEMQHKAGWNLLLNENRIIRRGNDSIFVVGSENDGLPPFPAKGDLKKTLKGIPSNAFKVLLSHDPTQWRRKVLPLTNIQLTLSGHTHAGQIKILGHSPSALVYSEWDGMYSQDGRVLFISSGVGEALVPFRLGAWPKIDIITLHSSK